MGHTGSYTDQLEWTQSFRNNRFGTKLPGVGGHLFGNFTLLVSEFILSNHLSNYNSKSGDYYYYFFLQCTPMALGFSIGEGSKFISKYSQQDIYNQIQVQKTCI